jgi:hypothetical protein
MKLLTVPIALCLTPLLLAQDGGVYQATDDIVVIEMESTPPSDPQWSVVTDNSDYLFRSFYRWDGPDYFGTPGNAVLGYRFRVQTQGNYRVSIRNRHDHPDTTLENDVWVRMDGSPWIKVYSQGAIGQWHWFSNFDPGHAPANWDLDPGEHLIEFSARSRAFMMDRFHVYLAGHPDGQNPNLPESPAALGSRYCDPAENNSTGQPAEIVAVGNIFPENNSMRVLATDLPPNQLGYVIASRTQAFVPFPGNSSGNLCLGGPLVRLRYQAQASSPGGVILTSVDLRRMGVLAGEEWNFQVWFRDQGSSNFTNAVSVLLQ